MRGRSDPLVVVDHDRSREVVRQPAPALAEQDGKEPGEERDDREHEPDETHERANERGGLCLRDRQPARRSSRIPGV